MDHPATIGTIAGRLARRWVPGAKKSGIYAGRLLRRVSPNSQQTSDFARQSGLFVKHVLPAAVKPVHSLWHQILGFFFLVFAVVGAWRIWSHPGTLPPAKLAIVVIFIVVMAGYGISSIRKSRRISRS